ncbi:RNA-binding protein 45-like [Helicoverpa zea]|uniref:RNA-binding protein 45-like n=1 Tax=Helicoverpa zea TaxID=7113 RepID=UPI001F587B96|nr:RNA-binding protein 45-like [Helicoverpa zea]
MSNYGPKRNEENSEDSPPHSRLFIVCERRFTEEDFREVFSKFGTIEDIRMPRNHQTGQSKGVVFIKFSKTSEAAYALEAMHMKSLKGSGRALKVMVATNRSDIHTDDNHDDKYKRLFLTIPYVCTEKDIQAAFGKYGFVESVIIQRNRVTGESRGFAYVTFSKFSEAAVAFEECDRKYRAIFALPRGSAKRTESAFESSVNDLVNIPSSSSGSTDLMSLMRTTPKGYTTVHFMCSPALSQMHVETLFDLIPGLTDCQYHVDMSRPCGKGTASYSNPICAAYAVEKLNEFEYPPGMKIYVKPDKSRSEMHNHYNKLSTVTYNLKNAMNSTHTSSPDLAKLTEAIAEASKLLKMATKADDKTPDASDLNYCSVKLPPPKPLADIDCPVAKRCFLVCKPHPPPLTVLRDIFCRFGDLINVYTLPNKTVGYARYATVRAADEAIKVLHGAEVCGVRIKVLEAEDESRAKKRRFDSEKDEQVD